MRNIQRIYLITIFVLLTSFLNALDVPALKSRVNDYANMISSDTENYLENKLMEFENSDSTQIAVLTINSLEGDALEDFSIRVVDKWKLGQKGKDNGVLLLVSKNDRAIRIEVGYGLEGVITDLLAGRIIDYVIAPSFKSGNFDQGFIDGVDALIQASKGEFKADKIVRTGKKSKDSNPLFILLFLAPFFWGRMFGGKRKGKKASVLKRGIGGSIAWIIAAIILFITMPGIGFSLLIFLLIFGSGFGFLFALIVSILPFGMMGSTRGGYFGSSSGFGGGGFGGGGFSGGGGGFGGGGASGGW